MIFILNRLLARTICRSRAHLGQKVLCLCILILLAFPFQLHGPLLQASFAAERLPVVLLQNMYGKHAIPSLLNAIQTAGFTPRTIREEDFAFNVSPKTTSTILLPVGSHISAEAISMLGHYMSRGGRVILIPTGEAPDASVERLFALAGIPISGLVHTAQNLSFNWKGMALPSGERLPASNPILAVQPGEQMDILATWGSDIPAIATTAKGAVLNWQWGHALSEASNIVALSRVIYPSKAAPLILTPEIETASLSFQKKDLVDIAAYKKSNSREPLSPEVVPNPKSSPSTQVSGSKPATAEASQTKPVADSAPQTAQSPAAQNSKPISLSPASKAAPSVKANVAGKGPDSADTEVLNNILGIPASESVKAGTAAPGTQDSATQKQQKPFSFLDPGAASVLAPSFDYGVYSQNLRKLDDYKRLVHDALEAGRQLSLDIPEDKVNALLKESYMHKRKFESLYLSGQTQAGLDENTLAHRSALQALALTTTSPQVEGRAIWMDRGSIIACGGPDGLKKRIQKLHQSGINIIYFETVNAGFPIYPSKLVKRNPLVSGWDPLKVAIDEGHKQGMEVHAWVWAFAVGNRRHNALINQPEDYAGPILTEAGMMSEALRNHSGGLSVDSHQHEFWLSPASPKARDFLLNLYKEIVTNYDVDGLQLDYIRYPFQTAGNRMGFEAAGREHFEQATSRSLENMDDYTMRVWTAWKTYQVNSFVQQVSTTLKQIKPELKLSAAVFPMRREARIAMIQQDWETWIDNGWIDTLSPMSYTSDPERLQDMFDYVQHSPHKHALVYPGIALFRLDGGQLVQHLEAVRQKGGLGTTLFAGSHLDDEKALTLANGPYKQINSLPPHHDVIKSLQAITNDYQQKLSILKKKGVLKEMPADQMEALQAALQSLDDSLAALGSGRPLSGLSSQKLQVANQRLKALRTLNEAWCNADKGAHPYRAEYFERDMLLLTEMMGYTLDKRGIKNVETTGPVIVNTSTPNSISLQHPTMLPLGNAQPQIIVPTATESKFEAEPRP